MAHFILNAFMIMHFFLSRLLNIISFRLGKTRQESYACTGVRLGFVLKMLKYLFRFFEILSFFVTLCNHKSTVGQSIFRKFYCHPSQFNCMLHLACLVLGKSLVRLCKEQGFEDKNIKLNMLFRSANDNMHDTLIMPIEKGDTLLQFRSVNNLGKYIAY